MGILQGCRAYTIGSMEYANGKGWRNYVKDELIPRKITVFDPYHKPFSNGIEENDKARERFKEWMVQGEYDKVAEVARKIRAEDLRMCDISDFLVVNINPKIASWGSAEELFTSNRMKKPIFISIEGGKQNTPLWLMGTIPHKYIYNSIEDSLDCIKKIDDGLISIDNSRWKLLREEYRIC